MTSQQVSKVGVGDWGWGCVLRLFLPLGVLMWAPCVPRGNLEWITKRVRTLTLNCLSANQCYHGPDILCQYLDNPARVV